MRVRPLTVSLTILASLVLASSASAANVKLRTEKAPSVKIGDTTVTSAYSAGEIVWAKCKSGGTPLMLGWTGPRAPVAITYINNLKSSKILGIAMRRTLGKGGTVKLKALCARGKIKVNVKYSTTGKVSCGKGKIAIGSPMNGGPYWTKPIYSVPVGKSGWRSFENDSSYTNTAAICVGASAFRKVKLVTQNASFKTGASTTKVSAKCRKGTQPISWGYESGLMSGNRWQSYDSGPAIAMEIPFVSAATAKGKTGWSLTFATADGKPATSAAPLKLVITCAAPR